MNCSFDEQLLDGFCDGELPTELADQVATHLEVCSRCTEIVAEITETKGALFELGVGSLRAFELAATERDALLEHAHRRARVVAAPGPWLHQLRRLAAVVVVAALASLVVVSTQDDRVSLAHSAGIWVHFDHASRSVVVGNGPVDVARTPETEPDQGKTLQGERFGAPSTEPRTPASDALALRRASQEPAAIYTLARERNEAMLWTPDLPFVALARVFSDLKQAVYVDVLEPRLDHMLAGLSRTLTDSKRGASSRLRSSFDRAHVVVEVARALLVADFAGALSETSEAELALIKAGELARSPLSGLLCDYSAIAVSTDTVHDRVDRTLAWLSQPRFALDSPEQAGAALCFSFAMVADRAALADFEHCRQVLDFFHGQPDGWSSLRLLAWLRNERGIDYLRRKDLEPGAASAQILARMGALDAGSIRTLVGDRALFSPLGQRFDTVAYVATQLTWPNVGTAALPRTAIEAVDVLAALGGAEAAALVTNRNMAFAQDMERQVARLQGELPLLSPRRDRGQDLFSLMGFARGGLKPQQGFPAMATSEAAGLARLNLELATLQTLSFASQGPADPTVGSSWDEASAIAALLGQPNRFRGHGQQPGSQAASEALLLRPRVGQTEARGPAAVMVYPAPQWFERLASLARATAAAVEQLQDLASRARVSRRLRDLAHVCDQLGAAARSQLAGRILDPQLASALASPETFCHLFLSGPSIGVRLLHAPRRGKSLVFHHQVVSGFDHHLVRARLPDGRSVRARGAMVCRFELSSERRLQHSDVAPLPIPDVPQYLQALYGPQGR